MVDGKAQHVILLFNSARHILNRPTQNNPFMRYYVLQKLHYSTLLFTVYHFLFYYFHFAFSIFFSKRKNLIIFMTSIQNFFPGWRSICYFSFYFLSGKCYFMLLSLLVGGSQSLYDADRHLINRLELTV